MESKNGKVAVVLITVFGIIFLGLIITLLIILNQKGSSNNINTVETGNMDLYLMARDSETQQSIDANYFIDYTLNNTLMKISEGKLTKDSWTEIKNLPTNYTLHISGWNKDHYLTKNNRIFSPLEKSLNISKTTIDMPKIGELKIEHYGDLKEIENDIIFNITAKEGKVSKISAILSWSAGIINAYLEKDILVCEQGSWINYSYFNATTQKYDYYKNNTYRCGEERIEECEYVELNRCKPLPEKIPLRFLDKADSNIYLGKSLEKGESYQFVLRVKTLENKNSLDYLELTFYDRDRRYISGSNDFEWVAEYEKEDIGAGDFTYRINY